jgi:hypothetical protein
MVLQSRRHKGNFVTKTEGRTVENELREIKHQKQGTEGKK